MHKTGNWGYVSEKEKISLWKVVEISLTALQTYYF
jgi:hypothetical protein